MSIIRSMNILIIIFFYLQAALDRCNLCGTFTAHSSKQPSLLRSYLNFLFPELGAIQVLHNALGMGVSNFLQKSITKVYGSILLAL